MSEPATTGMGRKIFKTVAIMLAGLAGLILVALVALYFLAEPLVERYLKKQVATQSDGLYTLVFEELQLHPFTMGFTLRGMHLYPDTAVHRRQQESGQAGRPLLEVQSPQLTVSGINLRDVLFNNRITLGTVTAEHPAITLTASATTQHTSARKKGGSPEAVRIRKIDLQEGSFRYQVQGQEHRPLHEVPVFSLRVRGLDLQPDTAGQQDVLQQLGLDGLDLEALNYAYHTPDSVYSIRVERFAYASSDRELKAEAVTVAADPQANAALGGEAAHRTLYGGQLPLLQLTGLEVAEAWRTKKLRLDRVLLERPDLQVLEDLRVDDKNEFPDLDELYARLSPYLQEIGVEELRLTDGSFRYRQQQHESLFTVHELGRGSLTVQDLQLDSASLFTPKEKSFAAEILLSTSDYTYSPLHSPYAFTAGSMELDTRARKLELQALHLAGDWQKNDSLKRVKQAKRTFYDIRLPRLHFRDLYLLEALQTSRLAIGSIALDNPVVDVRTDRQVAAKEEGPDLQELYNSVSGLVSALEVGEIRVTDASLTHHIKQRNVHRLQQLEHAGLVATGLAIDSGFVHHPDALLPLQDLVLTAQHYRYRQPDGTYTFDLASLRYSTRSRELTASKIDVISSMRANEQQIRFDKASRNLFDLSATRFRVTGLDLVRALNTRRLVLDQVLLYQPGLAILLDRKIAEKTPEQEQQGTKDDFFDLLDLITVNTIKLEDGSFAFSEKLEPIMRTHLLEHVTATATGFKLTPEGFANLDDELPVEELQLVATDYTYRTTDSLYIIRLDSLHYSSKQQEVIARSFTVRADRQVNERLKAAQPEMASHNLIDVTAKRSRITGFNLIHAYATGHYHMDQLLLSAPQVTILQDHNVPAGNRKEPRQNQASGNEAMEKLNELVTTFRIGRVQVTEGTFDFHIQEDTIRKSQTLDHVALTIDQLRLVSPEATDPLDIFDVDDLQVLVQGYSFYTRDSLYVLELKELRAGLDSRILTADSLRLRPLFSKEEYKEKLNYAQDRFDLVIPGIEMRGIRLRALFNNQDLIAEKLVIHNPWIEIYRDNSIGLDPDRRPPTLQQALREADLYIRLDTVLVDRKELVHHVIGLDGVRPALFLLEDLRMELYNVTNDTALIRRNNIVTLHASARFMGASTLEALFHFQMDHPEDRYTYEGTLHPIDFKAFNPLFENMMFIRVTSGRIGKATFRVESTAHHATGMVHFPYTNLKIQLLDKHDPEKSSFMLKAGTRLVNTLVIKSNNPSFLGNFRKGEVDEARDPQRAVFHHMGQSLLNGVTSSLMLKLVERIVTQFVDL